MLDCVCDKSLMVMVMVCDEFQCDDVVVCVVIQFSAFISVCLCPMQQIA
jgi:hypothetical protein